MNKLIIKSRMIVFLFLGSVALIGIAGFGEFYLYYVQKKMVQERIVFGKKKGTLLKIQKNLGYYGVTRHYYSYIIKKNNNDRKNFFSKIKKVKKYINRYHSYGSLTTIEATAMTNFQSLVDMFSSEMKKVENRKISKFQLIKTNLIINSTLKTYHDKFMKMSKYIAKKSKANINLGKKLAKLKFLFLVVVIPLIGLFFIAILFLFLKSINQNITDATMSLERLAEGDLSEFTEQDKVEKEELGRIQKFLKKTVLSFRKILGSLTESRQAATMIASESSNKAKQILQSSQEQAALLEEASASIEELSASTQSIFEAASKQLEGAKTNVKAMEDLKEDFVESAKLNDEVLTEAEKTRSKANEGEKTIESSVKSMEELTETSLKILGIIDVINDIADQTDLLALNASIEAARAGEHGKGFSVVAHEISELAERSASSSKEIAKLLKNSNQKVELGTEHVKEARLTFQNILNSMVQLSKDIETIAKFDRRKDKAMKQTALRATNVASLAKEIAEATKLQSQSAEEINEDMSKSNEITSVNVDQIEQLDNLMTDLEISMEAGLTMMKQFKLDK